ncbi:hypothetical protein [Azohydromonas caseinilytica]|uniref:Uncharacterized protein n=1 Tax=Azohydromonas caseinilytica TaxID=2728836 RepID=A0A848F8A7_9BURK|nr:hypothetical protein [Azohydromonas caseinilytica]NML16367.1 hypothetical protein [Azohydromonas caseinilytica]
MHTLTDLAPEGAVSPACSELRRRLGALQRQQPPSDPTAQVMRIGIEDAQGALMHVVETTRLVEAVRVFELLGELGWEPRNERCRGHDGRPLTRNYRLRR